MGMLNRESRQIRAKVIPNAKRETKPKSLATLVSMLTYSPMDGLVTTAWIR